MARRLETTLKYSLYQPFAPTPAARALDKVPFSENRHQRVLDEPDFKIAPKAFLVVFVGAF